MLNHPMFAVPPPKSLDRFDFPMTAADGLSGPDGAATLTAFTAASIARAREHFPHAPKGWIISGGGRHNPVLMEELRRRLGGDVKSAEDVGWHGDFIEAEAFAYLAVRSVKGLPLSLPSTTGVPLSDAWRPPAPCSLGREAVSGEFGRYVLYGLRCSDVGLRARCVTEAQLCDTASVQRTGVLRTSHDRCVVVGDGLAETFAPHMHERAAVERGDEVRPAT